MEVEGLNVTAVTVGAVVAFVHAMSLAQGHF